MKISIILALFLLIVIVRGKFWFDVAQKTIFCIGTTFISAQLFKDIDFAKSYHYFRKKWMPTFIKEKEKPKEYYDYEDNSRILEDLRKESEKQGDRL